MVQNCRLKTQAKRLNFTNHCILRPLFAAHSWYTRFPVAPRLHALFPVQSCACHAPAGLLLKSGSTSTSIAPRFDTAFFHIVVSISLCLCYDFLDPFQSPLLLCSCCNIPDRNGSFFFILGNSFYNLPFHLSRRVAIQYFRLR